MMVCVMVAMSATMPSYAQRLIPRQNSVELVGSMPIIKGERLFAKESFGVGLAFAHYFKRANYAFLLAEYEQQGLTYRSYNVPLRDALLHFGYMHPILSEDVYKRQSQHPIHHDDGADSGEKRDDDPSK